MPSKATHIDRETGITYEKEGDDFHVVHDPAGVLTGGEQLRGRDSHLRVIVPPGLPPEFRRHVEQAATALDCAVQTCGVPGLSEEIVQMEARLDEIAKEARKHASAA